MYTTDDAQYKYNDAQYNDAQYNDAQYQYIDASIHTWVSKS